MFRRQAFHSTLPYPPVLGLLHPPPLTIFPDGREVAIDVIYMAGHSQLLILSTSTGYERPYW